MRSCTEVCGCMQLGEWADMPVTKEAVLNSTQTQLSCAFQAVA